MIPCQVPPGPSPLQDGAQRAAIVPLVERMPPAGLAWLVAGGLPYTAGVLFYALDRYRFCHFIWHLFVLSGTACHFVAVKYYAAG